MITDSINPFPSFIVYEIDEDSLPKGDRMLSTYLATKEYASKTELERAKGKLDDFFDERDISVSVKVGDNLSLLTSKALVTFEEFKKLYM